MGTYYDPTGLNIARPQGIDLRNFNTSLAGLTGSISDIQNKRLAEAEILRKQANTDRTFGLQEANAKRQAQQAEYNMQITAAQMGATADRDVATAAHQTQVLANQAAAAKATDIYRTGQQRFQQEGRDYSRGMEAGEILGSSIPINETTMQPGTVTVPTADGKQIKEEEFARLAGMVGNTDVQKQEQYEAYLKTADPKAYEAYTKKTSMIGKAVDQQKRNMMTGTTTLMEAIRNAPDIFSSTSQADNDMKSSVVLKEGTKTRDQYMKDIAANDKQAKVGIAEFLKTDKPYAKAIGAMEDKVTSVAKRVDESKLRSTASQDIINYAAQNNLKANDPKVLGMQKVMNARIEKVVATRMAADVESVSRVYKQLDAQQKHQFDIDLLNMKQAFEGIMTPSEEAKMKLDLAKAATETYNLEEAKGGFW